MGTCPDGNLSVHRILYTSFFSMTVIIDHGPLKYYHCFQPFSRPTNQCLQTITASLIFMISKFQNIWRGHQIWIVSGPWGHQRCAMSPLWWICILILSCMSLSFRTCWAKEPQLLADKFYTLLTLYCICFCIYFCAPSHQIIIWEYFRENGSIQIGPDITILYWKHSRQVI